MPVGSTLSPADGLEAETWAEKELGGAPLGDERLSKRLVNVASAKAGTPGRAFCGVAQGDSAAAKGYYRLIDRSENSAVTMDNILLPHRDRTVRRMLGQSTVLCVQDGSDLDYNGLAACTGLGDLRHQPDRGQEPRLASAYHLGDLIQRTAAGRAEGPVSGPGAESPGR